MASLSYLTVCSFIWPAIIGTANQNITTQRISEVITIIIHFHLIQYFLLLVRWITIFISVIIFAKFSALVNTNKEEKISSKPDESDNTSISKSWYNLLFPYNNGHYTPTIITYTIIIPITDIVHTKLILSFNFSTISIYTRFTSLTRLLQLLKDCCCSFFFFGYFFYLQHYIFVLEKEKGYFKIE